MEIRKDSFWIKAITPNLCAGYFSFADRETMTDEMVFISVIYNKNFDRNLFLEVKTLDNISNLLNNKKLLSKSIPLKLSRMKLENGFHHFQFEIVEGENYYNGIFDINSEKILFAPIFSRTSEGFEYFPNINGYKCKYKV